MTKKIFLAVCIALCLLVGCVLPRPLPPDSTASPTPYPPTTPDSPVPVVSPSSTGTPVPELLPTSTSTSTSTSTLTPAPSLPPTPSYTPTASPSPAPSETVEGTPAPAPTSFALSEPISVQNANRLSLWQTLPISGYNQMTFSPDGKWLVAGYEGGFHFWDYRKGVEERTIAALLDGSFALSPDGRKILAEEGVFDVATGDLVHDFMAKELKSPNCWIWAFSGNGRYAACAGSQIHVWDTKTWEELRTFDPGEAILSIVLSENGGLLFAGLEASWKVYDVFSGKVAYEWQMSLIPLFFVPDKRIAWAVDRSEQVLSLVELGIGALSMREFELDPFGFTVMRTGDTYMIYNNGGKDTPTIGCILGVCPKPVWVKLDNPELSQPMAFSPDLMVLAGGGDGGQLELWAIGP